MNFPRPKNAAQAWRQACVWEKAQQLEAQGYRFDAGYTPCIYVFKPGSTTLDYMVGTGAAVWTCTCEDFQKHGDFCKHTVAAEMWAETQSLFAQAERAEEEAGALVDPITGRSDLPY